MLLLYRHSETTGTHLAGVWRPNIQSLQALLAAKWDPLATFNGLEPLWAGSCTTQGFSLSGTEWDQMNSSLQAVSTPKVQISQVLKNHRAPLCRQKAGQIFRALQALRSQIGFLCNVYGLEPFLDRQLHAKDFHCFTGDSVATESTCRLDGPNDCLNFQAWETRIFSLEIQMFTIIHVLFVDNLVQNVLDFFFFFFLII